MSECRVVRYDANFRLVFRTAQLQLAKGTSPNCQAMAVSASGTTYLSDNSNGVWVVDGAGVQQNSLPLTLPTGADLDSHALVTLGDTVIVAGVVGPRPWIGAFNAAGQLLWSHSIETADGNGWSALLAVDADQVQALFATPGAGSNRILLRRFASDGSEVISGHTDSLAASFPRTRLVSRGGSTVVSTNDDRPLLWRSGQSTPLVLEGPASPDGTTIYGFDVAPDGRVYASSAQGLLRFEINGSLGAASAASPLRLLQPLAIDSTRIVASAYLDAAGHPGIAQFDSNLAVQRIDPIVGTPSIALSGFAEGGGLRYLAARDYETATSLANSQLIAIGASGRERWRQTGDFVSLRADSAGIWAARDREAVRFAATTGEQLGVLDLTAFVSAGEFPRLYAGQAGVAYLDSNLVPGAPGECRVVEIAVAGVQALSSQPCGYPRAISSDGELVRIYQGALVRTRRDGTQRYSVPLINSETSFWIHTDGSVVLAGPVGWRLIATDGGTRWTLNYGLPAAGLNALFLGTDVAYHVHGPAPVVVSKYRLTDGALLGETQLGHIGPDALNIAFGRADAEGRLLLIGQRRLGTNNWELTTHVVEPDLSVRLPQVWSRGAENVAGVWSNDGAVYAAIGSPLDYRQPRPAIIRADGDIWFHGFED